MKKSIILITILIVTLIVSSLIGLNFDSDATKFKKDYESLNNKPTGYENYKHREIEIDKHNPIKYTTFKEVKEKIDNKESFVLYVGFSACPWCRSVIPTILKSAKNNSIDTLYYINVREDNTKESDLRGYYKLDENNNIVIEVYPDKYYHDVLNKLDKYLTPYTIENEEKEVFETGENRLYAPTLIAFNKGKAIALDECISERQKDPYQKLTKRMIADTKEKADKIFKKYLNK